MKMKLFLFGNLLLLLIGCSVQVNNSLEDASGLEAELLVSAAASLANSLEEIGLLFEQQHKGITVTYNYGSSGALQHQIEQGAPVDIFLSAGKRQMRSLIEAGLIDQEQSVSLLSNELVVIVPEGAGGAWDDLSAISRLQMIAMGEVKTVPAGEYAKAAFMATGVWDTVQHKIVYAKDVRQVLSYVETGNVDAGIVYKSDARTSNKVEVVYSFDAEDHGFIEYPMGIVKNSRHSEAAELYSDFLQSDEVGEIFEEYGFQMKAGVTNE